MRIGLYVSTGPRATLDDTLALFEAAERSGFDTAWLGQLFGHETLTTLALAGRVTRSIELGSWVIPTHPRHPGALAQQALTAQAASGGRLVLGVGTSHAAVVADRLGLDYGHPLRHTTEYLAALRPLLAGAPSRLDGVDFRVALDLDVPGASPPPLLLAALGPKMLDLATREADGVAIWLGGPRYLETFALPRLREASRERDRPFRVACGLPVLVTGDAHTGREAAQSFLARSSRLPAYRRVLDREGAAQAADVAIVGDERVVEAALRRLRDLGVTDFNAVVVPHPSDPGARERTEAVLSAQPRSS
jgi:F420-dependent oxidoreductase-like protein